MSEIIQGPWKNQEPFEINIPVGEPVDLIVLAVKKAGIRCKVLVTGEPVTYRKVRYECEGEVITVIPSKVWRFKRTSYLTGKTVKQTIDIPALNLKPLQLKEYGEWNPDDEKEMLETEGEIGKYYLPIIAYGSRKQYRLENVIPFENPDDFDSDPIIEAVEAHQMGDRKQARKIMEHLLIADLRCLDAHAHLGSWDMDRTIFDDRARKHYEIGIKIAELSLGERFNGLLPWGIIDNRPFLRCMHGFGLCLWRSGKFEKAKSHFERILWLNPLDNQGIRFILADLNAGKTWEEAVNE